MCIFVSTRLQATAAPEAPANVQRPNSLAFSQIWANESEIVAGRYR